MVMLVVVLNMPRAYCEQGLWLAFHNFSLVLEKKELPWPHPYFPHIRTDENKKVG